MKLKEVYFTGMLLLLLSSLHHEAKAQASSYNLDDVSNPYVFIQLREVSSTIDSLEAITSVKAVVDQIKAINTRLGYAQFEKKIASTTLGSNGMNTTYVSIRNFTDFKSAEIYAADIAKELPQMIYGQIKVPVPISGGNYRICLLENDFITYYKLYAQSRY